MNYEDKQVVTKGLQLVTMPWRTSFQQKKIMALDSVERFACKLRQKKYWLVAVMNFMGILFSPLGELHLSQKPLSLRNIEAHRLRFWLFASFVGKKHFSKMIFRKQSWFGRKNIKKIFTMLKFWFAPSRTKLRTIIVFKMVRSYCTSGMGEEPRGG